MKPLEGLRAAAGAVCLTFLALLTASGWALAAGYVPSTAEAFSSVLYWRQAAGLGALLRGLHHHTASGLVVAGFVYLLLTFLAGRHRGGRRDHRAWWLALSLYLLVLGACFTGFPLPMDQNAYWGTVVRLGIVETVPLVGPGIADALRGGPLFNASTLPRFYALHVSILPLAAPLLLVRLLAPLLAPLFAPLFAPRPGDPGAARGDGRGAVPWFVVALAAMAVSYLVASWYPAPLELPADATDSEYVPRPEWYFLWLFQFGKVVESAPWVRSLLLPAAGLGLLYALPLARRTSVGFRASLASGWCAAWIALTALAVWQDRELPPKLGYEAAMRAQAGEHFTTHCYDCHDDDGRGRGPQSRAFDLEVPDLTLEKTWLESSAGEMRAAIRDGKGEDMPAFGRKLSARQIDAMIDYLEAAFRPSAASSS